MRHPLLLILLGAAAPAAAQQVADTAFRPPVTGPAYPSGRGPLVLIDQGHRNFHTPDGGYRPFAELLRRDGFAVRPLGRSLTRRALDEARVLVIANATGSPAFDAAEVGVLREWVSAGGALLLVADHMPFPAAVANVGEAFGFELTDGFAAPTADGPAVIVFSTAAGTLGDHPVLRGRSEAERVDSVVSFAGHAFRGSGAVPLLILGPESVNLLPREPWQFDSTTVRRPAAGWWQGAVKTVGRGRVAVIGEAAMLTAQLAGAERAPVGMNDPAARQNGQFALNLLRWLGGTAVNSER